MTEQEIEEFAYNQYQIYTDDYFDEFLEWMVILLHRWYQVPLNLGKK